MAYLRHLPAAACASFLGLAACQGGDDLSNAHGDADDLEASELDATPTVDGGVDAPPEVRPETVADSGEPPRDTSTGDTTVVDSGTDVGVDGTLDTTPDGTDDTLVAVDTTVAADTAVAIDTAPAVDTAVAIDTAPAADTAPDVVVDTCVLNDCLTCGPLGGLVAKKGDACGSCGRVVCSADNRSLQCSGDVKNECGTCGALGGLTAPLGGRCGACGTVSCSADNLSKFCNNPAANVCGTCGPLGGLSGPLGSSCGSCGTVVCTPDNLSLTCNGGATNECGACAAPITTGLPRTACGACGTYFCNALGTATTCVAPDANSCGGCGTVLPGDKDAKCGECGKYVCTSGTTTTCNDPKFNSCGGCGTLAGVKDTKCGTCGVWRCDASLTSVTCVESSTAPGGSCTMCGTATYACSTTSPGTVTCPVAFDDRKTIVDEQFLPKTVSLWDGVITPTSAFAESYTIRHDGAELTQVHFQLLTRIVDSKGSAGVLYVTLFDGTPTAPGGVLGGGKFDVAAIKAGVFTDIAINIGTGGKRLTLGQPVFFELDTDSTMFNIWIGGTSAASGDVWPADETFWIGSNGIPFGSPGKLSANPRWNPYFISDAIGCF